MLKVFKAIGRISPKPVTVLVLGESGTGKELVARAIHNNSPKAAGPYVTINSASLPRDPNCSLSSRTWLENEPPVRHTSAHWPQLVHAYTSSLMSSMSFLAFSLTPYQQIPPEHRKLYRNARWDVAPGQRVPFFLAHEPGRQPRPLTRKEKELVLLILNAVLKVYKHPRFKPTDIVDEASLLTLCVTGDLLTPQAELALRPPPEDSGNRGEPLSPAPFFALQGLPRLDATWLLGTPLAPVSIEGDDRSVNMVLIADEESEMVVQANPLPGMRFEDALESLVQACTGSGPTKANGTPRELVVVGNRDLYEAVHTGLSDVGIRCRYSAHHPLLEELAESLFAHLDEQLDEDLPEIETNIVPDDDDLKAWKAVDKQLIRRASSEAERSLGDRTVKRYFGSTDLGGKHLADEESGCVDAFLDWLMQDYRATRRGKAALERVLAQGLPAAEEKLAKNRLECPPSIYRIAEVSPGDSLAFDDILRGGRIVVHDKALSECARADMFVVMRVYPAGAFHFACLAGPPLSPLQVDQAASCLFDLGLEPTTKGLLAKAHLFGRLWEWADEAHQQPLPGLATTDGDPMAFITATYAVGDEGALRKALDARPDVEIDEPPDRYTWYKEQKDLGAFSRMIQGNLTLIGGELLVEVTSVSRLKEARTWLDPIPGLSFRGERKRTVEEMMQQGLPPDDDSSYCGSQNELVVSEEMVDATREFLRQSYLKWLDEPLPALGGKTPRQTCRTSKGRRRVATMIRTLPITGGPVRIEPPIQELLDELGLADE